MKYESTLNGILSNLRREVPIIEEGDLIETEKTIYPDFSIDRAKKNVVLDGLEMTRPLAASQSAKEMMRKDGSSLLKIYKDVGRGDILKVKSVKGNSITVENLSINEEYRWDFTIDKLDVLKRDFIVVKRVSAGLSESLKNIGVEGQR